MSSSIHLALPAHLPATASGTILQLSPLPGVMNAALRLALLCVLSIACNGQVIKYSGAFSSGNSSVKSAMSSRAGMQAVLYTLAPCTALQPHCHNTTELIGAIEGTPSVGMINESSIATIRQMVPLEDLFELPTGMMHWIYNPTCAMARLIATFPVNANIQFTFAALRSVPDLTLQTWYLAGPLPTTQGSPLHQDPACLAACRAAEAAAAPGAPISGLLDGWVGLPVSSG